MILSYVFLYVSLASCVVLTVRSASHRNVLVLVADDGGFEMGVYNNTVCRTPNLDALGRRSVVFRNAFTSVSSCSPSRSAILTGLPQHQNGMYGLHHAIHHFSSFADVRSLSGILHDHNVRTGIIGKKHVGPDSVYPFQFDASEEHYNLMQVGRNITFMKQLTRKFLAQKNDRPFLLYIGFYDPHRCEGPGGRYGLFCEKFGNGKAGQGRIADWKPQYYLPKDVIVPPFVPDTPAARQDIAAQYTSINRMDQGVGLILSELKAAGFADDTLVIFTADNGIPFPDAKTNLYDPGMAEPMMVSSPEHRQRWGQESSSLVSLLDIVPTILDWYGISYPEYSMFKRPVHLSGRSMLPVLQSEPAHGWNVTYASHNLHEATMYYPMRVVRTRQYKLIHNLAYQTPYPIASDLALSPTFADMFKRAEQGKALHWMRSLQGYFYRDQWELYDVIDDPDELRNLARNASHAVTLKALQSDLYGWQKDTADPWICLPSGILMSNQDNKQSHCMHIPNGVPP